MSGKTGAFSVTKYLMRWVEIFESEQLYYHCSSGELPIGTVISGRGGDYEKDWGYVPFYQVLEKHRPVNALSHKDAVFMVASDDELDSAGGSTEYVFTLRPLGKVERHDMNWSSRISALVDDGFAYDSPEISEVAQAYWNGTPSDDPLWEYLTPSAEIVAVEEF